MKYFWAILLLCITLGNAYPNKERISKFLKHLIEMKKDEKRKLQTTDDTTDGGNDNGVNAPAENITAEDAKKNMTKTTGKSGSPYQIKKFYGFKQKATDTFFIFHMFFSFIKRKIARVIKMRILIIYTSRRLRNLEAAEAQNITSTCNISPGFTPEVEGNGENIDYECEAPKEKDRMVSNVNLDTSVPMEIDGVEVPFENVNFDEEAANEASNIAGATSEGGIISINADAIDETFTITGQSLPKPFLTNFIGKTIKIIFTKSDSSSLRQLEEETDCSVLSESTSETKIQCQRSGEITKDELNSAKSATDNLELTFNTEKLTKDSYTVSNGGSNNVYRKSSSGLSGGAIAGIVIACVAVLVAASIAAIMLRKPTPPIDNTTVVDLKQDNI